MEKIKAYVVNLPKSTHRKAYMEDLLSRYPFLDVTFIEAVDGRALTEEEIDAVFDRELAYQRYGRYMERGEIGCVLSHYKCYEEMVRDNVQYAFIFEDDISILKEFVVTDEMLKALSPDRPRSLMFSGDYWYYKMSKIDGERSLASVYDCVGAYAYMLNLPAAKLLLEKNPKRACVADHWSLYKRFGIRIKAVYPYVVDANIGPFESDIRQTHFGEFKKNMPLTECLHAYWLALIKKCLVKTGHFVSKIRKRVY